MKLISRILLLCLTAMFGVASAQSLSGSFAPASVPASTASTLTLNYSGFAPPSSGAVFRLYYNAAAFSSGPTFTSTVADFQGAGAPTAGTIPACAGANTFMTLNWVNFGNAWPSTAAGELGKVAVTTAASFNANTNMCIADASPPSPVARPGVNSVYTLNFTPPPTPTVSVVASPTALFDSVGNVSTVTFTASAAAPVGGFSVAITPPAANARYTTTCASPIIIAAGATTATCTVTAVPNTIPGDGSVTATTTVLAGTGYAVGTPASASVTVNDDDVAPSVSVAASPATLSNNAGGVSTVTFTSSAAAVAGGLSVTFTPPAASTLYTTTCASPIVILAGATTATCTVTAVTPATTNATATATVTITGGSAATYSIGTPSSASVVVTSAVPTVTVTAAPSTLSNGPGNVSTVTFVATTAAPAGGLLVSFTPPAASGFYTTTCASPIVILAGATTATCTITAALVAPSAGTATAVVTLLAGTGYIAGTPATASVLVGFVPPAPLIAVPTMSSISLALLALMIIGFVAFGQRRRLD